MKRHRNRTYFFVHLRALPRIKIDIRYYYDRELQLFYTYGKVPDELQSYIINW